MIRQVLTTAFCAALFFFLVFVIPAQANHVATVPYFCTDYDDAMETVRLQKDDALEVLRDKAKSDFTFSCWLNERNTSFVAVELMYEYTVFEERKGIVRAIAPDGTEVYLFGTMKIINELLHGKGV